MLECGSGLTTMLLGALAARRGVAVWTLEHEEQWARRAQLAMTRHGIRGVRLCVAPLRAYGDYWWYDPPLVRMPAHFSLVVCDGPPGDTPGGRYGLLPVLGDRLPVSAEILLDDAARPGEGEVLRRWVAEAKVTVTVSMHPALQRGYASVIRR